jgi:hypothetical protein
MNSDDDEFKILLGRIGNRGRSGTLGAHGGTADRRSGAAAPRSAAAGSLPLTAVSW